MASISDLPNEILIAILDLLGHINMQTLILSQLVDRRFHALVQDILSRTQTSNGTTSEQPPVIPAFLSHRFKGVFNTSECFTAAERRQMAFLSLDGDHTLPFRRLPWAQSPDITRRAAYTRPEATWRSLSVTFGSPPITHLDVVKGYSTGDEDFVAYYQVELPSMSLTLGLFYDLLLRDDATYGRETGSWEILLGRRLKSFDVLHEYECFIADDEDLVVMGEEARQAAILYVRGGSGCDEPLREAGEDIWMPRMIGEEPRLLPWQGPLMMINHSYSP